ncbi:MAG: nucleotide exchange factor GrpE [bacterium]
MKDEQDEQINSLQEKINELQGKFDDCQKEAEENLEGWKRAKADFINFKRRQQELMDEFRKFACENVVEDFIPILDNMELSLEHIPEDQKKLEWTKGIAHIKKMLEDALKANGVEAVETKEGDDFDPEIHDAVDEAEADFSQSEQDNPGRGEIKKVLRKGYKLNGKLIRAAKVAVK